jgi:type II secretory pathway component PulM
MQNAQVADQVVSYVGEFVLGGVALLCLAIAYWSIRELKQAHRDHVGALEAASEQHVEMHKAYQSSNSDTIAAIGRLTDTENAQTTAIQANTVALGEAKAEMHGVKDEMGNLRRSVDEIIREAVRGRRLSSDRSPAAGSSPGRYGLKGER